MSRPRPARGNAADVAAHHRDWLSLVEISGPFLSRPVLRATWPAGLDPLDKPVREQLRREHGVWADDPAAGQQVWIEFLLGDLLGWGDALHSNDTALDGLAIEVAEHDTTLTPSFALVERGEDVKPDTIRLLGMVCEPGSARPPACRARHGPRPRWTGWRTCAGTTTSSWAWSPTGAGGRWCGRPAAG